MHKTKKNDTSPDSCVFEAVTVVGFKLLALGLYSQSEFEVDTFS